jgi:hypothetical protein
MLGPLTVAVLPLVEVKVAVPRVRVTPAATVTLRLRASRKQHHHHDDRSVKASDSLSWSRALPGHAGLEYLPEQAHQPMLD